MSSTALHSGPGACLRRVKLAECLQEVTRGVGASWAKYRVIGATRSGLAPAKESVGKSPERYKVVEPGTIFYNPMRVLLGSIAIVDEGGEAGITSPDYVVFTTRPGVVHPRWFYYWLRSEDGADFIRTLTRGAVRERMLFRRLAVAEIALPSYDAQAEFAQQVLAVERARAAAEAQLEAAKALPAASLRGVFNSSEAKQWPRKPFGELVENFDGKRVPVKLDERRGKKGPYPYYGASGIIDHVDGYLFNGEYLLIGEDGANLVLRSSPIAFKAAGKFWVNNHAHVVQPKQGMSMDFLLYFFVITDLRPYITGAAQPKLTQEDMNSIPVSVPPPAEQSRIAKHFSEVLADAEGARQALEAQLATISALPAALLRRAFNGEL